MQLRKSGLPKDILNKINFYRDKDIGDLKKIKIRWARGSNRQYPRQSLDRLFYVDLNELVRSADFGEMMYLPLNPWQLFTGVNERDFRIAKILEHWSGEGHIDPPEICIDHKGRVVFGNGRHRTITAFHLGEEEIPIQVPLEMVTKISSLLKLNRKRRSIIRL